MLIYLQKFTNALDVPQYLVTVTVYRLGNKSPFCKHPSENTLTSLPNSHPGWHHTAHAPSKEDMKKISPKLTSLLYDNSAGEIQARTLTKT